MAATILFKVDNTYAADASLSEDDPVGLSIASSTLTASKSEAVGAVFVVELVPLAPPSTTELEVPDSRVAAISEPGVLVVKLASLTPPLSIGTEVASVLAMAAIHVKIRARTCWRGKLNVSGC